MLDFHRNTEPLLEPLGRLAAGHAPRRPPRAAAATSATWRTTSSGRSSAIAHVRDLLSDALDANLAQVTVRQNDDMRTISAWLAIGGFPTVVGADLRHELRAHARARHRATATTSVIAVMAVICFLLWRRFKKIGWL